MTVVGIDVTALSNPSPGGIGTSLYETMLAIKALDSPHRFLMYAPTRPVVPFTDRDLDIGWAVRMGSGLTTRSNILWMQTGVNHLLAEDGVEVFWSPRHLLPLRARRIAKVATIQDFWDRYFPGQQPPINRLANRLLIDRIARDADVLVTLSEATARDLERFCGTPREHVRVVPAGVDTASFAPAPRATIDSVLERLAVCRQYVVTMDSFNPRKNAAAVIAAVGRLATRGVPLGLVALGRPRGMAVSVPLEALAEQHGVRDALTVPGDVTREELVALFSGALAFAYPSVYEGFGIPVLEAMACGCPVVTSNLSSLPEVAGDAAVLVDPTDAGQIAAALARLIMDAGERSRLAEAGLARAQTFTWRRTAEGMLAAFEDALAFHSKGGGPA